ncbi:chloramphenicol-sensitive protein RarD [Chitinivorax tropicus]|uniref:Chloramphenicol-sensitive protein RarD n=1 Tax=Chitinivorax tropicus TaxID=714531 RepID=A0A840MH61_9PROT|nr:chloramphenicol-sensitive protein RarD [Chitinivorax tropicus]
MPQQSRLGLLFAFGAYFCWGLFPLYWKPLQHVPALEILAHRVAWSLLLLAGVLTIRRHWSWLDGAVRTPRVLGGFLASSVLLSVNWFIYIWAVNAGHVVESSLGYFINPLISVLLGSLVLHERLRTAQLLAVSIAALGVIWLTVSLGKLPWIALALAVSFGMYGLLRKVASLGSLEGLSLETMLIGGPAVGFLLWSEWQGSGHFAHVDAFTNAMLLGSGVVTAIPLLLFGAGARQLTLTTLGLMQYIAPTLQFLIGVFVYHEPFNQDKLVGFGLIWLALLLFSGEGLWRSRKLAMAG